MKVRLILAMTISSTLLVACGGGSNNSAAVPVIGPPPASAIFTARLDSAAGVIPFPNNLLLSGTTDLTLNIPVANPANFGDPTVALNALDGFSTVGPGRVPFSGAIKASSVVPGQTVRLFEVTLSGPGGGVTGVTRELAAGTDFVTVLASSDTSGKTLAVVPTRPLKQMTSYLGVVTNGVTDTAGNAATPDQAYFLAKRTTPICNGSASLDPLVPASSCPALENLRRLVNSHEAAAASKGVNRDAIAISWSFTTQSISPVLQTVRAGVQPGAVTLVPTGMNISAIGLPPIADIHIGTLDLPYYLSAPSATNPTAPLNTFWKAAPGAYNAPFNQFGLDPTSTNLTFANPQPVATTTVKVPVLMTVPNAASGKVRPASGWPLVIFQHGITRNRSDALAISAAFAAQGYAVVAIDQPLHGITNLPSDAALQPFRINNTPFAAAGARERTFDVDYVNNDTGAPGADGKQDTSGTHFINLASLLTSRDNLREAIADLFVLRATVPNMNIDGVPGGDFDNTNVSFVGQSLGSIVGTGFVALEPNVTRAVLSVPGGGVAQLLNGSPTFGPRIRAGLAASGVTAGTPEFDSFLGAAQQAVDSGDAINLAAFMAAEKGLLVHEVVGGALLSGDVVNLPDQVIPNAVATGPLSGTEPLIRALGLTPIIATTTGAPVRGVTRFLKGEHGSLLSPARSAIHPPASATGFLDVTTEMQTEMASFIVSHGTAVQVADPTIVRQN